MRMALVRRSIAILILFSAKVILSQDTVATDKQPKAFEFHLMKISRSFDFTIRMQARVPEGLDESDGYLDGPGEVLVFRKGERQPLQTISLQNVWVTRAQSGEPLANTTRLYDVQSTINVGDFNFDGHEDFAIQVGNDGSYGMPNYSVFLYNPARAQFALSKSLSSLTEESLGFFTVDAKAHHLIAFSKSGCCYHETSVYRMVLNEPIRVERTIEDETVEPHFIHITHEKLINGKWRETTKRIPEPPEPED